MIPPDGWVRPTTACWQALDDRAGTALQPPPWHYRVPVALPDGRVLELPIRRLGETGGAPAAGDRAVASLIANQAAFEVVDALADAMAALARPLSAQAVVGLPTLGMVFAPPVARALGHARWIPLGHSRKFWYDEALSTEVSSITTPGPGKRIYVDPNQAPLLAGTRVVVVDDAISSARTVRQVWDLLEGLGAEVAGVVVAMRQGTAWRAALGEARASRVAGAFDAPMLQLREEGWWPL